MSGFYELVCLDEVGLFKYYYFYSPRAPKSAKVALQSGYAPDAIRLLVFEEDELPVRIRRMNNIFEYIYKKYFKKKHSFTFGRRVDWEVEIKSIH